MTNQNHIAQDQTAGEQTARNFAARNHTRSRSRLILLLIVLMFGGSFGAALVLHYSGWQPTRTRNHGEFIAPAIDLTDIAVRRLDGSSYPWQPSEEIWRVLVDASGDDRDRAELLDVLERVWRSEGRHADRLDVLWIGPRPQGAPGFRRLVEIAADPALSARLAASQPLDGSLYVLDPSGYAVLRYRPGFDPSGLSKDLYRLVK